MKRAGPPRTWGEILDCSLIPLEARIYGNCQWCGVKLKGRRRVWCSHACSADFTRNHRWSIAREAARQDECESCGAMGSKGKARFQPGAVIMEVHHIFPRNGQRASFSCLNHLENLLCVCHACHVELTKLALKKTKESKKSPTKVVD